jgi:hypothetical protein
MLLGDLLARFGDETVAVDTLFGLGDLRLVAEIRRRAEAAGLGSGAFAARAVRRYAEAPDEEWITLVGEFARSDDPGLVFLRRALFYAMRREDSACQNSTAV